MLAQILSIISIGVLVYIMCLALDKKLIGYLVALVTVITVVGMVAEAVAPIVRDLQDKKATIEKYIK